MCEKSFLYSHEYRDKKMGGKRAKQLFQKHKNGANKKCENKSSLKIAKNVFYIHTNMVTKEWREGMRETIFPETHQ